MLKALKYTLLGLVLLLVFLSSALLSMRLAIHGREVRVPKVTGLTPAEAERVANAEGLALSVENRYYSTEVPQGRLVSQVPVPDSSVRRGWKILVGVSLGPQRAAIPNLAGQSTHAAGINLGRRGLEIGSVATIHFAGAAPQTVIAQNPRPDAVDVASPRIALVVVAADNAPRYVMPSFIGRPLGEAKTAMERAGFSLPQKPGATKESKDRAAARAIIVKQHPQPGQKIAAGATVTFEVKK